MGKKNVCVQQHQSTNLKPQTDFVRSYIRTSRFGLNSLRPIASKVWCIVPSDIKSSLRHIASKVQCIVLSDIENSLRHIASKVWCIVPSDIKNSLRHIASKVWCIVPSDIKNATNFHVFTNRIRKQEPKQYLLRSLSILRQ